MLRSLVARKEHAGEPLPATQGFEGLGDWSLTLMSSGRMCIHVDRVVSALTTAENELLVIIEKAVKSASARFPWMGSGFNLIQGMSSAYRGPSGTKASLLAAAQSVGSLDPGRGSSSTATSSTAKDAGTSSMPPPSVPSSALSKAGAAGSAASSQEGTAAQAPAAKGPPIPKGGGVAAVQGSTNQASQ